MSAPASVHVAIVNWNTAAAAIDAAGGYLDSAGVRARVTIVDNASTGEQRAHLRAHAPPGAELVLNERNIGYGAAVNLALAGAEAEFVCASNADVRPAASMLAELAAVAAEDRAGLVAPALGGAAGYHAHLPCAALLPLRAFSGNLGHRSIADPPPGVVLEVGQPAGACLLLRSELWRRLAGFDPGFFLWFEDVDLARRVRAAGYTNLVAGAAVARHEGGRAFAQLDGATRHRIWCDSLRRYAAKHHPGVAAATRLAAGIAAPSRGLARRARTLARLAAAGRRAADA